MLGFYPISAAPISAVSAGTAVFTLPPKRKYARRTQPLPPQELQGNHRHEKNFLTGLAAAYTFRKGRHYHQPLLPLPILRGHFRRHRLPNFTFVPPHAPPHKAKHRPWFPLWLLEGNWRRGRVPGSGLTAHPIRKRSRLVHQPFFPVNLLGGRYRRVFPQEQLEVVVPRECPDRRHPADEAGGFYGVAALGTDTIAGVASVADAIEGAAPAEADARTGVSDASDGFSGTVDECK